MSVRIFLIVLLLLTLTNSFAIENLGTYGKVYEIEEEDILEYVKRNAKMPSFSQDEIRKKIRKAADVNLNLPVNKRDNVRFERIIYTVPDDIVINGTVIAKKGTQINVLQQIKLSRTYIVLADYMLPYFLDWSKKTNAVFLITKGNILDLEEKYPNITIYAALPEVVKALRVRSIPSIVYQSEDRLVILEKGFRR